MYQFLAIFSLVLAVALAVFCRSRGRGAAGEHPVGVSAGARAVHVAFAVTLALMALSSLVMLAFRSPMRGWMLILHMAVAPVFAIAIALLALMWAQRTSRMLRLVLLSGFVTILTAMFTMMTWFGSDWQRWLLNVHRLSSMVLLVAGACLGARLLSKGRGDAIPPAR